MDLRRIAVSALSAAVLLSGVARVASADDWCSDDPPINIKTPAGHSVVVKVTDYAYGTQHLAALKAVTYAYVATPDLDGVSTDVVLTVNIPGDIYNPLFQTRSVVSTAADENSKVYQVYADHSSVSGTAIVHTFKLATK
jgi:hypothetical protein